MTDLTAGISSSQPVPLQATTYGSTLSASAALPAGSAITWTRESYAHRPGDDPHYWAQGGHIHMAIVGNSSLHSRYDFSWTVTERITVADPGAAPGALRVQIMRDWGMPATSLPQPMQWEPSVITADPRVEIAQAGQMLGGVTYQNTVPRWDHDPDRPGLADNRWHSVVWAISAQPQVIELRIRAGLQTGIASNQASHSYRYRVEYLPGAAAVNALEIDCRTMLTRPTWDPAQPALMQLHAGIMASNTLLHAPPSPAWVGIWALALEAPHLDLGNGCWLVADLFGAMGPVYSEWLPFTSTSMGITASRSAILPHGSGGPWVLQLLACDLAAQRFYTSRPYVIE